ncbi:MAG: hypothetical protein QXW00_04170 [Candidatus Woesearchaeota archaeon]
MDDKIEGKMAETDITGTNGLAYLLNKLLSDISAQDFVSYKINRKIVENKVYSILNQKNSCLLTSSTSDNPLDTEYCLFLENYCSEAGLKLVNQYRFFLIKRPNSKLNYEIIDYENTKIMCQYTEIFTLKNCKNEAELKKLLSDFKNSFDKIVEACCKIEDEFEDSIKIKVPTKINSFLSHVENIKFEHQKNSSTPIIIREISNILSEMLYPEKPYLSGFDLSAQNEVLSKYDGSYLMLIARIITGDLIHNSGFKSFENEEELKARVSSKANELYAQPLEEIINKIKSSYQLTF